MSPPRLAYQAILISATISVMIALVKWVLPLFEGMMSSVSMSVMVGAACAAGVWALVARTLFSIVEHNRFVKKKLFGIYDIHGTWLGKYTREDGQEIFSVELIHQTLDGILVRGGGFTRDGVETGEWASLAAAFQRMGIA